MLALLAFASLVNAWTPPSFSRTVKLGNASYYMAAEAISLVSRPGCDYMLLDLVAALADAGILATVKTGRTAF